MMRDGEMRSPSRRNDIVAIDGAPDWYLLPEDFTAQVAPIPRTDWYGDRPAVHRSVLAHLVQAAPSYNWSSLHRAYPQLHPQAHEHAGVDAAFDRETSARGWTLRPYQHAGRNFLRARRGAIIADTMRLGKTATSVASHDPESGPLVVIAPLATREVWCNWFRKRWPGVKPVVVTGRRYDPDAVAGAELVFGHYDILPAWQSLAAKLRPGTLVFDEAHVLSKPTSRRTQAALTIATFAQRVIAATGTPLWNKPAGVWPMLACINPGAWGKYHDFAVRYAGRVPGAHGFVDTEPTNVDEFRARIGDVMLLRTWRDVHQDLPETQRQIVSVETNESDLYEVEILAEQVRDNARLRTPIGELARFRRLVGQLKVKATAQRAVQYLDQGESVVVWTWHKDVGEAIEKAIENATYGKSWRRAGGSRRAAWQITGETPASRREHAFDMCKIRTPSALVITMGVGQVGIDLSWARKEIFAEVDFTPAVVAQAEMRTFSPVRSMSVDYMVLDHEIDRRIVEILVKKCLTAEVIGTPAAESAIDLLGDAFNLVDQGDMDRLAQAVLGDAA